MKTNKTAALAFLLVPILCVDFAAFGQEVTKNQPPLPEAARDDSGDTPQAAARDALARFENPPRDGKAGLRNWKMRMECLVAIMKAGPGAVSVLVDGLKADAAETRAFAAQALGFLADTGARPALVQAVDDKEDLVRLHAIRALSRLGRLEATPKFRALAGDKDPVALMQAEMTFALTRDDKPNPEATRQALAKYDLARMDSAQVGKAAPDFTLADASGKEFRLRQFRGDKAVVLVFLQMST